MQVRPPVGAEQFCIGRSDAKVHPLEGRSGQEAEVAEGSSPMSRLKPFRDAFSGFRLFSMTQSLATDVRFMSLKEWGKVNLTTVTEPGRSVDRKGRGNRGQDGGRDRKTAQSHRGASALGRSVRSFLVGGLSGCGGSRNPCPVATETPIEKVRPVRAPAWHILGRPLVLRLRQRTGSSGECRIGRKGGPP